MAEYVYAPQLWFAMLEYTSLYLSYMRRMCRQTNAISYAADGVSGPTDSRLIRSEITPAAIAIPPAIKNAVP
jgi:hypothetical protein